MQDPEPCAPPTTKKHDGPEEPDVPKHCWSRRFDATPPRSSVHKPSKPGIVEIIGLLPVAARVGRYVNSERRAGREPIFDLSGIDLHPPDPGPVAGVPLGGIGGGSICRGWKGDFNRWSLWPGRYRHGNVLANQFSIRVCPANSEGAHNAKATILSMPNPSLKSRSAIKNWDCTLDASKCAYYGLFPRAWTVYEWEGLKIVCKQVSPVLPHDYATSSLPASAFVWTIENTGKEAVDVSLMFSFQNGDGGPGDAAGGHRNKEFDRMPVKSHPEVDLYHQQANATDGDGSSGGGGGGGGAQGECRVKGVSMEHLRRTTVVFDPKNEHTLLRRPGSGGGLCQGLAATCIAGEEDDQFQPPSSPPPPPSHAETTVDGNENDADNAARRSSTMERDSESPYAAPPKVGEVTSDTLTFGVAALEIPGKVNVSICETFETSLKRERGRAETSTKLWNLFLKKGNISKEKESKREDNSKKSTVTPNGVSWPDSTIASAVCQQLATPLQPGEARQLSFSLCWDCPHVTFGSGKKLPRRYTKFFRGASSAEGERSSVVTAMCAHTLARRLAWEFAIDKWQRPILDNPQLPSFYKCLLFNELYFIVDGGTVWTDSKRGISNQKGLQSTFSDMSELKEALTLGDHPLLALEADQTSIGQGGDGDQENIGQFLYLEGHEYLMYNTYDVHFYASFALTHLWPQLQLSLQRDFALAVMEQDVVTVRRLLGNGTTAPRKIAGAVPHDLGSPCEEPWTKVNVYNFQDVSRWKDLGPKFVLTVLRDYEATQSKQFVAAVFPTVAHVMAAVAKFDTDGDGLIENSGFPDQTYDIWSVSGPSAYTGGLWVASLSASLKLASVVEEAALHKREDGEGLTVGGAAASDGLIALAAAVKATYSPMYEKAKEAYEEKLWNGTYFNYDSSDGHNSDSVMSDQCAGLWYARACSLEPTVEPEKAAKALRTVYQYNVKSFVNGKRGCVNGMKPASVRHPNGVVDNNSMQSREVWTGTTYAVAAAMLQEFGAEYDAKQLKAKTPSPTSKLLFTPKNNKPTTPAAAAMKRPGGGSSGEVSLWDAAFGTIRGMWLSGWNELGYWYATPEGWEASGNYRSLGYMRPLSVWAMQYAIEKGNLIEKHSDEHSSSKSNQGGETDCKKAAFFD